LTIKIVLKICHKQLIAITTMSIVLSKLVKML